MLLSLMFRCRAEVAQDATQRSLKRTQSKAIEWKLLREKPKITLAEALGRDRLIDERTELSHSTGSLFMVCTRFCIGFAPCTSETLSPWPSFAEVQNWI
jgi:hypothetical protein